MIGIMTLEVDLKSLPFWECQFESGRGQLIKPFVISDKNSKSSKIKSSLKKINTHSLSKSNLIIVIGGDGFMLEH